MQAHLANFLENVRSSLWFLPALMVLGAAVLASALVYLDARLQVSEITTGLTFGGGAEAARTLLQVVAGSLITVVAIAFSVTIVALAQAASQYSPRVLGNFMRDRGNQFVLGMYLGTFTYALLVLRQVRTQDDGGPFVPSIAITVAIGLALASLGALIYFIHHVALSLQASTILQNLREELHKELRVLFPSEFEREQGDPPVMEQLVRECAYACRGLETVVCAESGGYLRAIDEDQLSESTRGASLVRVRPYIGQYVLRSTALAHIWTEHPISEEATRKVHGAFVLDQERSIRQDPLFGIRQIVDIGVKALSPGINDPATAEQCLANLGDVIVELSERTFPTPLRRSDEGTLYLFERMTFADYVDACFSQIRRHSKRDVHVTLYLLAVLHALAARIPTAERAGPLSAQVEQVLASLPSAGFSRADTQAIHDRAMSTLDALPERARPPARNHMERTPETAVSGGI